jgi:hypothetical protein
MNNTIAYDFILILKIIDVRRILCQMKHTFLTGREKYVNLYYYIMFYKLKFHIYHLG